ncbi:hypothetical protein [uncultured Sphaerochaeta sp.]|uniref:hypothetical protein n=1 Tax=uncultured Sphaerochaeta sp. TaxID=886478 RepID=UPI002A0A652D|nr:hypothetical protein [uncultured Sphaerochaeta sp.]
MTDFMQIAQANYQAALTIIEDLRIEETWKEYKAQAHLVGSIKTGLIMCHLDIDFHIYSDNFCIDDSFAAVGKLALNPRILKIAYINNCEAEDKCLEWHLEYKALDNRIWQIDLIHIMKESPYVGKFERVADKINTVMTLQMKKNILQIKWELSQNDKKAMGIQIYKAVIEDNISTYAEFLQWQETQQDQQIIQWEPTLPNISKNSFSGKPGSKI